MKNLEKERRIQRTDIEGNRILHKEGEDFRYVSKAQRLSGRIVWNQTIGESKLL